MDVEYPSATFPARPSVAVSLPDTFEPIVSASILLGAGDTASPAYFRANLVVICTRVVNDMTLDDTAADLRAKTVAEYPGARLTDSEHASISGLDSLTTLAALRPANLGFEIEQSQTVIFVPTANESVRDLLQIHASYASDTREHYAPLFLDAVRAMRIGA